MKKNNNAFKSQVMCIKPKLKNIYTNIKETEILKLSEFFTSKNLKNFENKSYIQKIDLFKSNDTTLNKTCNNLKKSLNITDGKTINIDEELSTPIGTNYMTEDKNYTNLDTKFIIKNKRSRIGIFSSNELDLSSLSRHVSTHYSLFKSIFMNSKNMYNMEHSKKNCLYNMVSSREKISIINLKTIQNYDYPHNNETARNDDKDRSGFYLFLFNKEVFMQDKNFSWIYDYYDLDNILDNIYISIDKKEKKNFKEIDLFFGEITMSLEKNDILFSDVLENVSKYNNSPKFNKRFDYLLSTLIKYNFSNFNDDIIYMKEINRTGDSFYMACMFSYLERIIINKDVNELKNLMIEINNKIDKKFNYREVIINKENCLVILYVILKQLNYDNISTPINYLHASFCNNKNFVTCLIQILKIKIANFIYDNENNFSEFGFYKILDIIGINEFKSSDFVKNYVLINDYEPNIFIILVTPYILNMNINLYIKEQDLNKIIHFKTYAGEKDSIDILYQNFSYNILYSKKYFLSNDIFNKYEFSDENFEDEYFFEKISEIYSCEQCHKISNLIVLKRISKDLKFCQNCLLNAIDDILLKRLKFMSVENFKYKEYYLRNIILYEGIKEIKYLNQKDLEYIGIKSIFDRMINLFKNLCVLCCLNKEKNIEFECDCKLCFECLKEKINKNKLEYLTYYEENNSEKLNNSIFCNCGNIIRTNSLLSIAYTDDELEKIKEKANKKLKNIECVYYCMNCGRKGSDELDDFQMASGYGKDSLRGINITVEMKNIYNKIETFKHFLCEDCVESIMIFKTKEDYIKISCKICGENHKLLKNEVISESKNNKNMKNAEKEKNNACCNIF